MVEVRGSNGAFYKVPRARAGPRGRERGPGREEEAEATAAAAAAPPRVEGERGPGAGGRSGGRGWAVAVPGRCGPEPGAVRAAEGGKAPAEEEASGLRPLWEGEAPGLLGRGRRVGASVYRRRSEDRGRGWGVNC